MRGLAVVRLSVSCILIGATANAQTSLQQKTPYHPSPFETKPTLELKIKPLSTLVGKSVTISGMSPYPQEAVKISVSPPSGPPADLSASAGTDGRFSVEFSKTEATGEYRVDAVTKGDLKSTTHFNVLPYRAVAEDVAKTWKALFDEATANEEDAETKLRTPPLSVPPPLHEWPDQEQKGKKIEVELPQILIELARAREAHPNDKRTEEVFQRLEDWREKAQNYTKIPPRNIPEYSSCTPGTNICEKIDLGISELEAASFILTFLETPLEIVSDFIGEATEHPWLSNLFNGSWIAGTFAVTGHWHGVGPFAAKVLTDAATWAAEHLTRSFCTTYEGEFDGKMRAISKKDGRAWWRYTVEIQGKVRLRRPSDSSQICGEFVGWGTHFTVWEDAVPVLYPKVVGLVPAIHKLYATFLHRDAVAESPFDAIGLGIVLPGGRSTGGSEAQMSLPRPPVNEAAQILLSMAGLNPAYFNVPFRGNFDAATNKITIHLLPARSDFDPVWIRAKVKYLFTVEPSMLTKVVEFALPYKDAHFILARAMGDDSPNADAGLPIDFEVEPAGQMLESQPAQHGLSAAKPRRPGEVPPVQVRDYDSFERKFEFSRSAPTGEPGLTGRADYELFVSGSDKP